MTTLDDRPTRSERLDMEAVDRAAQFGPLHLSDCEGHLAIWKESALRHVQRNEHGEIVGYSTPGSYDATDLVAEWDLDTWDRGQDGQDDEVRDAAKAIVTAVNSLPVLSNANRDLGKVVDLYAEVMRSAIQTMWDKGAAAGMAVIQDFASEVPELLEGLDDLGAQADAGVDRG